VRQAARELGQALAAELRKQFGLLAVIGVSRVDAPAEALPESMHEAAVALQLGLKLGRELSFFDDESKAAQGSGPLRLMARLGELRDAYSKALVPEAALAADRFVADVLLQSRLSVEVMRLHFRYAFSALQASLAHRALLPPHRLVEFERQWLERLEAEESPHGLSSAFREGLQAYLNATSSPSEGDRALRLEQARRYVDEHCLEPISIKAAAAAGGFSASRFSRLFAEATGVGFGAYLLQRRLDQAKQLLRQSKLPLQQIAFDSGFNSLSYFSQAFKRETGMNPSRFRNKHKIT
jgi:AraC-like DNA-binding protein